MSKTVLSMHSVPAPVAIRSTPSQSIILKKFLTHFKRLVLDQDPNDTAFSKIMYVRIVIEVCNHYGISCKHKVGIDMKKDGLCVRDIIEELKDREGEQYRSTKTFQNYHGWVHKATFLLSQMENEAGNSNLNQSPLELRFMSNAKDLLRTPLENALSLDPSIYGNSKHFVDTVDVLMQCRQVGKLIALMT